MAPLQLFPSFTYLLTLLTTPLLAKKPHRPPNTCPTITKFTTPTSCPTTTPSVCPQPDCILVSSITVPCGCPTTIPTSAVVTPCPTACAGNCGTYISTVLPPQCRPSTSSEKKVPSVSTVAAATTTITGTYTYSDRDSDTATATERVQDDHGD